MASTKIYTKTGDSGTTGLVNGTRVAKSDPRLEAYGTVDELNAVIGLLQSSLQSYAFQGAERFLLRVQNHLFNVGSQLACADKQMAEKLPLITAENIQEIENEIDILNEDLPELRSFILPGGHILAAHAHLARTVCRRAERACCHLQEITEIPATIVPYINRLSDYLFVLARFFNHNLGIADTPWEK
ncbi:MAG: cob(I)yrinic acid a,c-diamide adenosyltransferase [Bdellovibrionaceae bacterium]|nr:cob(I)yrinic acid a,c-diamide adenosyltransferase [Pseudobdellovibrionaceae bacterium]